MIRIKQTNNLILISVSADIINTSSQSFDLSQLKSSIIEQLKNVFNKQVGKFKIAFNVDLNILLKVNECSPKRILFQIVDTTPNNNPAICDFKGLRVKLNKLYVNDIIIGKNSRTIPHEVGHLLGWDHPHANAKFESINTTAHLLEQQLTETERQCNLMSQSWYAQKAGIPLEDATQISEKQIEVLLENYTTNSLNKNWHLKYFLWWKKII
ncbi:MAG: hypothetical protein ABIP68_00515 [Ferruginibacter sp.]